MPHRILVVDDEESIRSTVSDYLEGLGYSVQSAEDVDQGIERVKSFRPHLALIDFLLPKKNGFAVAEAIRRDPKSKDMALIMMSGVFKNPRTGVEAREKYQAIDFLSKPLDLEQLGLLIRESLAEVNPSFGDSQELSRSGTGRWDDNPKHSPLARAPSRTISNLPREGEEGGAQGEIIDGIFHGRPFPPMASEGIIEEFPIALLLSILRYDAATGMLDLTDQGTHRRIYIVEGNPSFMQSNAEGENVGALLLRRGRITEPDFQRCLQAMKDRGRTLQQSLLELRLVSEQDLATAYKLLAGQLLPSAIAMASGTFRWRETDAFVGRVPEGKFEPVAVLFDGIRRHVHPPQILRFFKGYEEVAMVRTTEFDRLMPYFRRAFSASNIASKIDGTESYRSITKGEALQTATVVPQMYALVTSGMVVLPEIDGVNSPSPKPGGGGSAASDEGARMSLGPDSSLSLVFDDETGTSSMGSETAEEKRAKATILRFHEEVFSRDFFEVLNVKRNSDEEAIKSSYFELTRKWSSDAFADLRLGPVAEVLEEIFQRITEAYETITDKHKREDYIAYIDRKSKGLSTDVDDIVRAERLFEQGQAMIRRRDWEGARPVLGEAIQINPGEPAFYAALGWVTFNQNPKAQESVTEAVNLLRRAVSEHEGLAIAYQYLGAIAEARGQTSDAVKWWQRCLEWEPGNIDAARGLRTLNQRDDRDGGSKANLLGRFITKKQ